MTKKKYKIWYDKKDCIGAASCEAVQPTFWKMEDDMKASMLDERAIKNDDTESIILELTQEELEKYLEGAEVCPVNIIHIEEVDSGKKLI
tara:strand:- start:624 stop:893 length:270 start_codon:yes stop_codon:yes gene_type:complete